MSDERVVETIYGKHSKFEVVKTPGNLVSSPTYWVFKDGKRHRGTFPTLERAVEDAKREAAK